jgi:hypothetical protein
MHRGVRIPIDNIRVLRGAFTTSAVDQHVATHQPDSYNEYVHCVRQRIVECLSLQRLEHGFQLSSIQTKLAPALLKLDSAPCDPQSNLFTKGGA